MTSPDAASGHAALVLGMLLTLAQHGQASARGTGRPNILYIVFDDLRPDLSFYGASWMKTPHLQSLADGGTVFDNAYCQQTVCSPSRMSFTTGRRPNTTQTWNFLNHFRQADCPNAKPNVLLKGRPLPNTRHPNGVSFTGLSPGMSGGSGQCCTDCTATPGCAGWQLSGTQTNNSCTLFSRVSGESTCHSSPQHVCIGGRGRGAMPRWTPLPEHLRAHGYLALGVGKYYHDVNRGLGVPGDDRYPAGQGLPPEADPVSWSNVSVQNRNLSDAQARFGRHIQLFTGSAYTGGVGRGYVDAMDGCGGKGVQYYAAPLPPNGSNHANTNVTAPCDYIAYVDAIEKLRFAAQNREATGQPFFLAVGIRRPHLTFRAPQAYADAYPVAETALPRQPLLDGSIDPIAWTQFAGLGGESPYNLTNTPQQVRTYRAAYYAVVSWADYAAGQVLGELSRLGLDNSTLVVMHADHGWHLGEYNMWEKRTLWENAARVPLVLRAPWLPSSVGRRTSAPVELVDLYPTVCEAAGVPLPAADTHNVEGTSLMPLLEAPARDDWAKDVALTTYPRCPSAGQPDWRDNSCIHSTERTDFAFMGYSMHFRNRISGEVYRYTEWLPWDGARLAPVVDPAAVKAVELYNHTGPHPVAVSPFDCCENVNLAPLAAPGLLASLRRKLRESFAIAWAVSMGSRIDRTEYAQTP